MTGKPCAYLFNVTTQPCTEIRVTASRVNSLSEVKVCVFISVFISAPEELETGVLCIVCLTKLAEPKSYLSS